MLVSAFRSSFPIFGLALCASAQQPAGEISCELRDLVGRFAELKAREPSSARRLEAYAELDAAARAAGSSAERVLGAWMRERFPAPTPPPIRRLGAPECGGILTTTTFSNPSTVVIPDATSPTTAGWGTIESPIFVAGITGFVWDVDVHTNLQHTRCNNLRVSVISAAGTSETLTTDNNLFGYGNLFNGTTWDDSALVPITDYPFVNGVPATAATPEGALGGFVGQDPNGVWVLLMRDDTPTQTGQLDGWSIDVTTLDAAPSFAFGGGFQLVNQPVPDAPHPGLTSTITVSGLSTTTFDVNASIAVTHSFPGDLAIFLTSPAGTTVTLTTYNGGNRDDVFNGTTFDDNAPTPATDFAYVPNVAAALIIPDGALSAFMGEDPNGAWTLRVRDDLAGDTGFCIAWSLEVTACAPPPPPAPGVPFCAGDGLDPNVTTPCPCGNTGAAGNGCANSAVAAGAHLDSSGTTSPDTAVLLASGMPATSTSIFLKGDVLDDALFGDGVRCAGGNLIRMKTIVNVNGASQFPGPGDPLLSVRGQTPPGSGLLALYQTYYRNAAASFCPPATFNVTSGQRIVW